MKKVLCVLIATMLLFSTPVVGAIDIEAGVDTEFVIDRTVKLKDTGGLKADYSAQYYDVYTKVVLGDNLVELKPRGGIQTFRAVTKNTSLGDIESDSGVGWNVGLDAQVNVYSIEYADFAVVGGYRFSRTDIDSYTIAGAETDNPIETIVYTHEWEMGAKVSKDLSKIEALQRYVTVPLTPYIGVVYSDLIGEVRANTSAITGTDTTQDIRAENKVGIRAGLAFQPIEDLTVSIDTKFVDQIAIGASASYKF